MSITQLGIGFFTGVLPISAPDAIIKQVETAMKADIASPSNLTKVPNCTTLGYDINFLKDPSADVNAKLLMINLYDFYLDPDVPADQKLNTDGIVAETISNAQKAGMKTILTGDGVNLASKDKKIIDLCVRKTLEYLLDNLKDHIHVTVTKNTDNTFNAEVTVDPVGLI